MILTIAHHELRRLLLSPLAWTLLAALQLIVAWSFLTHVELFLKVQPKLSSLYDPPGLTDLVAGPTLGSAALVLMFFTPLITMRQLSGERTEGAMLLLLASPASSVQIVLGKFVALLAFLTLQLGLIAAMPASLSLGGSLDVAQLATACLGLWLLGAAFLGVGLAFSALASQPTAAAIGTLTLLAMLWMAGGAGGPADSTLARLGLLPHYQPWLSGLFSVANLTYFLLLSGCALMVAIWRLDARRVLW